jgi:hypothetical protein
MNICNGLYQAVKDKDSYLVINMKKNCIVESHSTESNVIHATDVLNKHEVRNDREPIYAWRMK